MKQKLTIILFSIVFALGILGVSFIAALSAQLGVAISSAIL